MMASKVYSLYHLCNLHLLHTTCCLILGPASPCVLACSTCSTRPTWALLAAPPRACCRGKSLELQLVVCVECARFSLQPSGLYYATGVSDVTSVHDMWDCWLASGHSWALLSLHTHPAF
jgi:hypothetical protein